MGAEHTTVEGSNDRPAAAYAIPDGVIEQFCDSLQPLLQAALAKHAEDLYAEMLYNVQDYLKSNAVFNISGAFEASERDRLQAWRCLNAVLASATLGEAKANARAGERGYWTQERAEAYRTEALALLAHRQENEQ